MRNLFNFYVFASLFNVTYISLRQIIHVFRLKFNKRYATKYNEELKQSEMKTQEMLNEIQVGPHKDKMIDMISYVNNLDGFLIDLLLSIIPLVNLVTFCIILEDIFKKIFKNNV